MDLTEMRAMLVALAKRLDNIEPQQPARSYWLLRDVA